MPAFLTGGHLMELSQEPQILCFLPRLVVTPCVFTANIGQRARSCFGQASTFIYCHSVQLLRSPMLYVLLMKMGDRAGGVQGMTFLVKATSTRENKLDCVSSLILGVMLKKAQETFNFIFLPLTVFFFFASGFLVPHVYTWRNCRS